MNKTASTQRVASIHLARMEKRAAFASSLANKVVSSVMASEADKILKGTSSEAKKGLSFLVESLTLSNPSDFKGHKVNNNDPLQKMISYALQNSSSRAEVRERVGSFTYHYNNKNLKGMAKALGLEEEVVGIVLLSYAKGKTASRSVEYEQVSSATDTAVTNLLDISSKSLSLLERFIDGGVGFLVSIFPDTVQNVARQPLKWTALALVLKNSWWVLGVSGSFSAKVFAVGWAALASFSPLIASLVTVGVTATAFYFLLEACVWTGDAYQATKEWSSQNVFDAISLPFRVVWILFRSIIQGTYKVARWVYNELRSYVGLFHSEFKEGHLNMKHITGGELTNDEVFDELMMNI